MTMKDTFFFPDAIDQYLHNGPTQMNCFTLLTITYAVQKSFPVSEDIKHTTSENISKRGLIS